jgi:UDP-glucose 4-epimerase
MEYQKVMVTGGAGFIGSSLVEELITRGKKVVVLDNLSSGNLENISHLLENSNLVFVEDDLSDPDKICKALEGCQIVFHLAASPDVRIGLSNTRIDFENNVVTTYNLLEAMRKTSTCKNIVFTSTSTIYGNAKKIPTPERYGPLKPISLYGSSKLACESYISGYSHMFGFGSAILRFANIIGPKSNHGVIFDFKKKLDNDPDFLEILGDGTQNKSYLYIDDCINGILTVSESLEDETEIFNIGSENQVDVFTIANLVTKEMGLENVEIKLKSILKDGGGWLGDVKNMQLDVKKIKKLGWESKHKSSEAVTKTIRGILSKQSKPITPKAIIEERR